MFAAYYSHVKFTFIPNSESNIVIYSIHSFHSIQKKNSSIQLTDYHSQNVASSLRVGRRRMCRENLVDCGLHSKWILRSVSSFILCFPGIYIKWRPLNKLYSYYCYFVYFTQYLGILYLNALRQNQSRIFLPKDSSWITLTLENSQTF